MVADDVADGQAAGEGRFCHHSHVGEASAFPVLGRVACRVECDNAVEVAHGHLAAHQSQVLAELDVVWWHHALHLFEPLNDGELLAACFHRFHPQTHAPAEVVVASVGLAVWHGAKLGLEHEVGDTAGREVARCAHTAVPAPCELVESPGLRFEQAQGERHALLRCTQTRLRRVPEGLELRHHRLQAVGRRPRATKRGLGPHARTRKQNMMNHVRHCDATVLALLL